MKRIFIFIVFLFLLGMTSLQSQNVISSTVEFSFNTNEFVMNGKYDYFINTTIPYINNNKDNIESILLVGSASPEGNKEWNDYLAGTRAEKVHSYFMDSIPRQKVNVINDYDLFLEKTGYDEKNWKRLRATYIEIQLKKAPEIITLFDTIYIKEMDTIYQCCGTDTVYIKQEPERIPLLAVKTNLLSDVLITPSIQAELYTHLWGLSLEFDYTFPWYHNDDIYWYYQILNGTAGIRKYLNNKYYGHYFGIYGNTFTYDICFDEDNGYQGEGNGISIGYGYVFRSKKHPKLKFEPYIRLGYLYSRFDTYHASNPWDGKYYYNWHKKASEFAPRRLELNYFGPTAIGFNITYDLVWLRKY